MTGSSTTSRWSWLWPEVETEKGATNAIMQAFGAAVVVAAITAAFALSGATGVVGIAQAANFDASSLADALLFGIVAWGLWKRSRVAEWTGLLLYLAERAFMWSTIGVKNPVLAAIFILAFVSGVRGTSAARRMKTAKAQDSGNVSV